MYSKGTMESTKGLEPRNAKRSENYTPKSKYFDILSGMTTKELREFAKKHKVRGCTTIKVNRLANFLDDKITFTRGWELWSAKADLERRMYKNMLRAWVGLFVSDKSIAEHYTQIIFHTLSSVRWKPTNPLAFIMLK